MLNVKVKKLHPSAKLPSYGREGDAGLDITTIGVQLQDDLIIYRTGLSFEIPSGYVGYLFPRSSICNYGLSLSNSVGVIDSNFRGELVIKFRRASDKTCKVYDKGDRIAQLVVMPVPQINLVESSELSDTNRGTEGFGSSGR